MSRTSLQSCFCSKKSRAQTTIQWRAQSKQSQGVQSLCQSAGGPSATDSVRPSKLPIMYCMYVCREALRIMGYIGLLLAAFEDGLFTDLSFFSYVAIPSILTSLIGPALSMLFGAWIHPTSLPKVYPYRHSCLVYVCVCAYGRACMHLASCFVTLTPTRSCSCHDLHERAGDGGHLCLMCTSSSVDWPGKDTLGQKTMDEHRQLAAASRSSHIRSGDAYVSSV